MIQKCVCFLWIILVTGILACSHVYRIPEPAFFRQHKIYLGATKAEVLKRMGKGHVELNYKVPRGTLSDNNEKASKYAVSVLEYDKHELDYNPADAGDDIGILAPHSGIREIYQRSYRLVFINNRLYSIQDFLTGHYYALSGVEEIQTILENQKD